MQTKVQIDPLEELFQRIFFPTVLRLLGGLVVLAKDTGMEGAFRWAGCLS